MNPSTLDSATEHAGSDLAREMRRCWRRGEQTTVEDILHRCPELWQRPEAAIELVYEEYCLRHAAGQGDVEQDLLRRFPQWAGPLRVMLDCHRLLQSGRDQPRFPEVGETLGEFRLLAELGRGARGRVFLASQTELADRPVVLKMTPLDGGEHLSLARLQHTNIVPLHSFTDDPVRNIRVLCMPYFGRATLGSLAESLVEAPLTARTGKHVVAAIDRMQEPSEPPAALMGAARQMLSHVSYVQAMCWITACLADALQFAHERGLVHLDLKPSNVLLASDGQPMLLDFHLAHAPIPPLSLFPENFGGTPGYMAAEQQAAMQALQNGRPVETAVDGRADLFALGAMLYQSLGGALPLTAGSPPLSQVHPQVSTGLSDIVSKCAAHLLEDRYASAAALADDLRRHLTDQPLVGVRNRSIAERLRKWRRRRPSAIRVASMLAVVAGAAGLLLAGGWSQIKYRQQQADRALRDGQAQLKDGQHYSDAARTFERGLALAQRLPFQGDLRRELRDQLATATRLHVVRQLHDLADEIRVLHGTQSIPIERLRSLASYCRAFWEKRDTIVESLKSQQDQDVTNDLRDVALFSAHLPVRLSDGVEATTVRQEALRILDEVEAMFGPSAVLVHERNVLRRELGLAETPAPRAASPAPRTAWEHYALGRAYFASNDLARADKELIAALAINPTGRWPNFYYGLCANRLGRHDEALSAFSVCIGLDKNNAVCFYNRGLAYVALGRPDQAMRDYDRALRTDPTMADAALNRGVLYFKQKQQDLAIADLRGALRNGADPAKVYYNLAVVHAANDDRTTALNYLRRALQAEPTHEQATQLRNALEQAVDSVQR